MSSVRSTDGTLSIVLVGPQDASFRIRSTVGGTECRSQKGKLDAVAAKGLPSISVQHYILTCPELPNGKKITLLTKLKLGEFTYEFENPVIVSV
jgi:hypothetical protein